MTQVHLNPDWVDAAGYLALLNAAFPGQWNRTAHEWYLRRSFNGQPSDLLVMAEGSRILAGMALCHRQVAIEAGRSIDVGVISAAATVPEERKRGHYEALLRSAIQLGWEKRYIALLGFVTRDNGSGRGLIRLGARAIPSFYIVSPTCARGFRSSREDWGAAQPAMLRTLARQSAESADVLARFHYVRDSDWTRQFIERPHPVRLVRLGHDACAAIETVGATDRLQLLACPDAKSTRSIARLAADSAAAGKQFFMYTLDERQAAAARRTGLRIRPGYMLLQPTGCSAREWRALETARWSVQSGDRI